MLFIFLSLDPNTIRKILIDSGSSCSLNTSLITSTSGSPMDVPAFFVKIAWDSICTQGSMKVGFTNCVVYSLSGWWSQELPEWTQALPLTAEPAVLYCPGSQGVEAAPPQYFPRNMNMLHVPQLTQPLSSIGEWKLSFRIACATHVGILLLWTEVESFTFLYIPVLYEEVHSLQFTQSVYQPLLRSSRCVVAGKGAPCNKKICKKFSFMPIWYLASETVSLDRIRVPFKKSFILYNTCHGGALLLILPIDVIEN